MRAGTGLRMEPVMRLGAILCPEECVRVAGVLRKYLAMRSRP